MHMIRSHDVFVEMIAFPVEIAKCSRDKLSQIRTGKNAGAVTGIQPFLHVFRKKSVEFHFLLSGERLWMCFEPLVLFGLPLFEPFSRQRIGQAKGDEICGIVLAPVREISGKIGDRFVRIEKADGSILALGKQRRDAVATFAFFHPLSLSFISSSLAKNEPPT
mgnify:CR=1 FL=1